MRHKNKVFLRSFHKNRRLEQRRKSRKQEFGSTIGMLQGDAIRYITLEMDITRPVVR